MQIFAAIILCLYALRNVRGESDSAEDERNSSIEASLPVGVQVRKEPSVVRFPAEPESTSNTKRNSTESEPNSFVTASNSKSSVKANGEFDENNEEPSIVQFPVESESSSGAETNSTANEQESLVTLSTLESSSTTYEVSSDDNETTTMQPSMEPLLPFDEDKAAVLVEKVGDNFTEYNITAEVVELSEEVIKTAEDASKILTKHSSVSLKLSVISLAVVGAFLFILYSYCLY